MFIANTCLRSCWETKSSQTPGRACFALYHSCHRMAGANEHRVLHWRTLLLSIIAYSTLLPHWAHIHAECEEEVAVVGVRPIAEYTSSLPTTMVATSSSPHIVFKSTVAAIYPTTLAPVSRRSVYYSRKVSHPLGLEDCKSLCSSDVTCVGIEITQISSPACMVYFADIGSLKSIWTPSGSATQFIRPTELSVDYVFDGTSIPILASRGCVVLPVNPGISVSSIRPEGVLGNGTIDIPPVSFTVTYISVTGHPLIVGVPEIRVNSLYTQSSSHIPTGTAVTLPVRICVAIVPTLVTIVWIVFRRK